MKNGIYEVTALIRANCTEYNYVVDVDADNQKEAIQIAKAMWNKVNHLFHVKARKLEYWEEAFYAFWTQYNGKPETKSTAHVMELPQTTPEADATTPDEPETETPVNQTGDSAEAGQPAPRSEFVFERLYSKAKREGGIERLHSVEVGGGYSDTPHVEVWTEKVAGGFFATTIYNHTLVYSTRKYADTPEQAERDFTEALGRYLQPLQAAAFAAGMKDGGKYTILCYNDFGELTAHKIRFHSMEPTTYAQYGDAVRITCTPFRGRGKRVRTLYNKSFAIYDGWQDLPESATTEILKETPEVKVTKWKWRCWDADGFTACKGILKNCLTVYEDFKTGVNGRKFA